MEMSRVYIQIWVLQTDRRLPLVIFSPRDTSVYIDFEKVLVENGCGGEVAVGRARAADESTNIARCGPQHKAAAKHNTALNN